MTKPAPPPARKSKPPAPARQLEAKAAVAPTKKFSVETWGGDTEGEKIILYADSGMGKTTLASTLPDPVFIGLDDGGRKILNPKTGEQLKRIPNVETFDDVRSAIRQVELFDPYKTLVTDTGTLLQDLALEWTFENVKAGDRKAPYTAKNIEDYGWGKGYRHLYDTMKLVLPDLDGLVRRGKNIAILCQMAQVTIANAGGADFLCDVPKLMPQYGKSCPAVWSLYNEWADHVLKIGYADIASSEGKAASSGERVVFVHGQVHFKAKSRTIPREYPIVSFSEPADDSIWQFIFNKAYEGGE